MFLKCPNSVLLFHKNNKLIEKCLFTTCQNIKRNLLIASSSCFLKKNHAFLQFQRFKSIKDEYNFFINIVKDTSPALVKVSRIAKLEQLNTYIYDTILLTFFNF